MSDDRTPASGAGNTREQRLQALRALAQAGSSRDPREEPVSSDASTSPGAPPTTPITPLALASSPSRPASARQTFNAVLSRQPASRTRWPWRVVALVALVAILAAGVTFIVRYATPRRPTTIASNAPTSLAIYPQVDGGVACPSGAAISPDSQTIVVVGYQTRCPDDDLTDENEPAKVVIYATHKRLKTQVIDTVTLSLDMLSQKIGSPLPSQVGGLKGINVTPVPTLLYGAPIWSPHGERIAIPFVVEPACFCLVGPGYQFNEMGAPTQVGLLEMSASGQFEAALSTPYSAAQQSVEWDTQQRTLVSGAGQLAPAQTYTWSGSRLIPTNPLSAKASSGPIGATQGATTFSIWQSGWGGSVFYMPTDSSPTSEPLQAPGVFTLTPTFSAWSPDGRWLLLPNFDQLVVRLNHVPAPPAATLQLAGLAQAPQVAARDAALNSLFASIPTVSAGGFIPPDAVAWSPNGGLLAAASALAFAPQASDQVTLRDARTGKVVATLIPAVSLEDALEVNPLTLGGTPPQMQLRPQLQWSTDGSRLFLLNPTIGSITIWTLPAAR